MPRHTDVTCPPKTWVILTDSADASITGVRLQNIGGSPVRVQASANTTPPASVDGALNLGPGDIRLSTETLAQLFPGVTSPLHLFAYSEFGTVVSSSHA